MFGTSPACEIQLEKLSNPEHQKEGRIHFRITYDDSGNLLLQDISDSGTVVAYNSQNINEQRRNFIWNLDLVDSENEQIKRVIYIPDIQGISFQVFVPTHKNCKAEYIRKRQDFLDRRQPTTTPFDHLKAKPNRHTRSGEPVYYRTKKTIKGGFGEVKLVYDLSTGIAYAQKTLFKYRDQTLKALHNEARIMRKLDHRHIVPLRSFTLDPAPTLIMPYYHFGNLKDQNKTKPITLDEINILFHQALLALEYLHSENVAHRDLKPENILIESRVPFVVRVSDFGISKSEEELISKLGTPAYMAPEIYDGKYTPAVDLWSLGVVVMQYAFRLPPSKPERNHETEVQPWCYNLVRHFANWPPNPLQAMVAKILTINPQVRMSASACLELGYALEVFTDNDGNRWTAAIEAPEQPSKCYEDYDVPTVLLHDAKDEQPDDGLSIHSASHEQAALLGAASTELFFNIDFHPKEMVYPDEATMAHVDYEKILLYTVVDEAVRRGIVDSSQDYFRLPFRDGDVEIRKKDHRVHLTGALTKAGINRKAIAKLRGRKPASRYRVSKKRNYQWNHITLKTAMEFATTYNIKELEQLLLNFIDVLDMLT